MPFSRTTFLGCVLLSMLVGAHAANGGRRGGRRGGWRGGWRVARGAFSFGRSSYHNRAGNDETEDQLLDETEDQLLGEGTEMEQALLGKTINAEMLQLLQARVTDEVSREMKQGKSTCESIVLKQTESTRGVKSPDTSNSELDTNPVHSDYCHDSFEYQSMDLQTASTQAKATAFKSRKKTAADHGRSSRFPSASDKASMALKNMIPYRFPDQTGQAYTLPPFNARLAQAKSAWYNRQWAKNHGIQWCTEFLLRRNGFAAMYGRSYILTSNLGSTQIDDSKRLERNPQLENEGVMVDFATSASDAKKQGEINANSIRNCEDPEPGLVAPGACSDGGDPSNNALGKCDHDSRTGHNLPANPLCNSTIWQAAFKHKKWWKKDQVSSMCRTSYSAAVRAGVHAISTKNHGILRPDKFAESEDNTPEVFMCASWAATCSMAPYPAKKLCKKTDMVNREINNKGEPESSNYGQRFNYTEQNGEWVQQECLDSSDDCGKPGVPAQCATDRLVLGCWNRPKGWKWDTAVEIEFGPCEGQILSQAEIFA